MDELMWIASRFQVVDLFSGLGGLTLGFLNSGFQVVGSVDNWKPAIWLHRVNFPHPILDLDLSDVECAVNVLRSFGADMVIGGPPCQDFSWAGQRNEHGARAQLTPSFSAIVVGLRPKFFVMENVDGITGTSTFEKAKAVFHGAGYGLTSSVLDACRCGVPQKRKRCFVVGALDAPDGFLDMYFRRRMADRRMTIRDYVGDIGTKFFFRPSRTSASRAVFSIDEPSPTIRGVNRPIPRTYQFHPKDAVHDRRKVRPWTMRERALLQTFPEEFYLAGVSERDAEQLIGNAVPVTMGAFVARCLAEYVFDSR